MRFGPVKLPLALASILALSLSSGCSSGSAGAPSTPRVLDPTQQHYGHTSDEWGALWFKWIFELPQTDAKNCIIPYLDPTGSNCGYGQSGDVFFLAGTAGGAVVRDKCVIPAGKAILFPILNAEADNAGVTGMNVMTDAALQMYVQGQLDGATGMSAALDGVDIPNLGSYRTQITKFTYTLPPEPNFLTCNAVTGWTGPVSPAYAAGYYVLLAPPAVGSHTLHFVGTQKTSMPTYTVDVTYKFTVQ